MALSTIVCIAFAARQDALTTEGSSAAQATAQGHRLVLVVLAATLGSCVAALGARLVLHRLSVSRRTLRIGNMVLACTAVVLVVGLLLAVGGPRNAADRLHKSFNADPVTGPNQNSRLFSISGNGRAELFRVAWDAARRHPVVGSGSGTFEYIWYSRRPNLLVVRDAHSLYLETLAELGIIGLGLLVSGLLVMIVGGICARRTRFAASGTAALLAWVAAAAVDWHWEMVGVTLVALLCGAAALVASERHNLGRRSAAVLAASLSSRA